MNTKIITIVCLIVFAIGCIEIEDTQPATPSETVGYFIKHLQAGDNQNFTASYQMMSTSYRNTTDYETFIHNVQNTDKSFCTYKYNIVNETVINNTVSLDMRYDISYTYDVGINTNAKSGPVNETIELIKEPEGWRFELFPTNLVLVAKTN